MVTVHTCPDIFEIYKARSILEDEGIKCVINNETISVLAGGLPYAATWPQLDIFNDEEFEKAKEALKLLTPPDRSQEKNWDCPGCNEHHEPQFERCWKCGHEKAEREY